MASNVQHKAKVLLLQAPIWFLAIDQRIYVNINLVDLIVSFGKLSYSKKKKSYVWGSLEGFGLAWQWKFHTEYYIASQKD